MPDKYDKLAREIVEFERHRPLESALDDYGVTLMGDDIDEIADAKRRVVTELAALLRERVGNASQVPTNCTLPQSWPAAEVEKPQGFCAQTPIAPDPIDEHPVTEDDMPERACAPSLIEAVDAIIADMREDLDDQRFDDEYNRGWDNCCKEYIPLLRAALAAISSNDTPTAQTTALPEPTMIGEDIDKYKVLAQEILVDDDMKIAMENWRNASVSTPHNPIQVRQALIDIRTRLAYLLQARIPPAPLNGDERRELEALRGLEYRVRNILGAQTAPVILDTLRDAIFNLDHAKGGGNA